MTITEKIFLSILVIGVTYFIGMFVTAGQFSNELKECGIVELKCCRELREGKYKVEWREVIVTSNAIIKITNGSNR